MVTVGCGYLALVYLDPGQWEVENIEIKMTHLAHQGLRCLSDFMYFIHLGSYVLCNVKVVVLLRTCEFMEIPVKAMGYKYILIWNPSQKKEQMLQSLLWNRPVQK